MEHAVSRADLFHHDQNLAQAIWDKVNLYRPYNCRFWNFGDIPDSVLLYWIQERIREIEELWGFQETIGDRIAPVPPAIDQVARNSHEEYKRMEEELIEAGVVPDSGGWGRIRHGIRTKDGVCNQRDVGKAGKRQWVNI